MDTQLNRKLAPEDEVAAAILCGGENAKPDNWSPEQETALLLDLCEAQMDAAMRDSDRSVDALVGAFAELTQASMAISELSRQISAAGIATPAAGEELAQRCDAVGKQINEVVVAMQFYDKLSQRMGHVRHSLTTLAMFVCNRPQTQNRDHWIKLLASLRRLYRTAEERAVFDLVAEGASLEDVRSAIGKVQKETAESSIELF